MPTYNELKRNKASESFREAAVNGGFSVVGDYLNAKTKVDLLCSNGHAVSISPSNLKKGRGCSFCSKKGKEQAERNFISSATSRGFVIVGNYRTAHTPVLLRCPDGHSASITPTRFSIGGGCSECSGLNPKWSERKLKKTLGDIGYSLVGKYINNSSKVDIECSKGHTFSMTPHNIKAGQMCSVCRGNNQMFAYIHHILDGSPIAVKFGIATNAVGRLKTQRVNNKSVSIECIGVWSFKSTLACRNAETFIKRIINRGVVSRELMPDGWTETASVSDIHLIIKAYEQFGGVKVERA